MTPVRPKFSIVTAVYNVEPYLAEFIASIEGQRVDPSTIEVVAVDDGSTDGSLDVLKAWAARARVRVTVLHQENRGQASARNAGLRIASGEWVTFTDPDDVLHPGFFSAVLRYVDADPRVDMLGALPVLFDSRRGPIRPRHSRTALFRPGDRTVDLEREPTLFPGSSTVAVFRHERVREMGLAFDVQLQPVFEDQHFSARFLLGLDRPVAALLRSAKYFYRQRVDGDSTLQRSYQDEGWYGTVLERGFLDLIERARRPDGSVPVWVQHLVLYDLAKLFREHDRTATRVALPPWLAPRFHELLRQVLSAIEPDTVRRHVGSPLSPALADALAHGFRDGDWRSERAVVTRVDEMMGLQRVVYRHSGRPPVEVVTQDGRRIGPAWAKWRPIVYFGQAVLQERILWVPTAGKVEITLDGAPVTVVADGGPAPVRRTRARPPRGLTRIGRLRWRVETRLDVATLALERFLARSVYRARFRNAWVLMDRVDEAGDNGERLFEYLRRARRDVNAWYVVQQGTPDWERLRATGSGRVVAYGSRRWRMLMLNARWLISSHADRAIWRPKAILRLVPRVPWSFGFLQHGVTMNDLSPWLNQVEMDLFVVSTAAELAAVADDGTRYAVTHKETRLTGMPRLDGLLAAAAAVPPGGANLVIVAPTWRTWLTLPLADGEVRRSIRDAFWSSPYLRAWLQLLGSPQIADAVAARGWRLAFMPHPNVQQILPRIDLPPHVEALSYVGQDVRQIHARCALMVTDYSSVAFNTAYLDRPVVYYQFDRDEIEAGRHIGRRGYFEYERDGFGPVALDHESAVAAIVASIEHGPTPTPMYLERIARTFPNRDGGACARVVAAIEELSRPWEPRS